MNFSATPDFLPFPSLSCKAHKGGSTGKMLLAAQQKAHGSCPDGLPFCLGQSYSHNPPTPVVCVAVIPVSPGSFHTLPSRLVQPHGAKGRALSPPAPACKAAQCVILRLQVINHGCLWQSPCLKDETHSFYNFSRKK